MPCIGGRRALVTEGEKTAKRTTAEDQAMKRSKPAESTNVGNALRAVYQDAIGESVPDEMLDLLSKLK